MYNTFSLIMHKICSIIMFDMFKGLLHVLAAPPLKDV